MKRPACFIACLILIFLSIYLYLRPPEPFSDDRIRGSTLSVEGTVDDKYSKNSCNYLIIKDTALIRGGKSATNGKVIIKLKESDGSLSDLPVHGARVRVTGKGMLFSKARNPGNFDLADYEMIRGIDYEIYDAVIDFEAEPKINIRIIDEGLCILREKLRETAGTIYKEEDSGIISAMLLGDRGGLSGEIKDSYRRSGMSHILCISSLHVTLLGACFLKLIRKTGMNRTAAYIISFTVIAFYGRLTGSGVSTMRALITFALIMTADLAGRTPDLLSSLSTAGILILMVKPMYVLDAGFILSFTSVCGIGILGPVLKKLIPSRKKAADSLRTSIAITVFMLPVTLYYFFSVPLYSVLINLIVIPLLTLLLFSALISVAAGSFIPVTGFFAAVPAKLILSFYRLLTDINDRLPFSVITTGRPEMWKITVFYLIIAALILCEVPGSRTETDKKNQKRHVIRSRALWITGVVTAILVLSIRVRPHLVISMIDTGQGDCHFFEIDNDTTVMIDCGSSDISETARYRVIPYIRSRGYDRIDYAVVTHTDEDHISGYREILSGKDDPGVSIGTLILPDVQDRDPVFYELFSLAKDAGTAVATIRAGDKFRINDLDLECLNPVSDLHYPDANSSSVCLLISSSYSGLKALYTGDLQDEGEEIVRDALRERKDQNRLTLLKCAHHGSSNSTDEEFLKLTDPAVTFISAGIDNIYHHPSPALLDRLEKIRSRIFVTSESGAVRMDVFRDKVRIYEFIK